MQNARAASVFRFFSNRIFVTFRIRSDWVAEIGDHEARFATKSEAKRWVEWMHSPDSAEYRKFLEKRQNNFDIIFYENQIMDSSFLKIPHPRMHERCFVLMPLCDIGADVVHPVLNQKTDELLRILEKEENQEVIPLD